jgi:hypothetical protein
MLAAGDVRVTVTDLQRGGEHITVRFKAMMDNRVVDGGRPNPEENKNWIRVPLKDATHVFIEVPRAGGEFPDKIGSFYPKTGRFYADQQADPERVGAAVVAAIWMGMSRDGDPIMHRDFRFQEESYCGVCGRTLTDPESIERGIGPECYSRETNSQHQVKNSSNQRLTKAEKQLVEEILEAVHDLSEAGQRKVKQELDMWFSQER